MECVGGLDIGTTGAKIVVFSLQGDILRRFYAPYPSTRGNAGHELDARTLKETLLSLARQALEAFPSLLGLGITSFGESFVCLDENDDPVYPILLYTDPRGKEEARELDARFGAEVKRRTGLSCHEMYSLPKLAALKKEGAEKFRSVKKVLLMEDYGLYVLSGQRLIDPSLASRTLGYSLERGGYDEEIFSSFGLSTDLFSPIAPAGTAIRGLRKELFPGKENFLLAPCGHDQFACAIGSGVFEEGQAMEGAGTVECIVPCFDPRMAHGLHEDAFNRVPYFAGKELTYAFSYAGGAAVAWFLEAFCSKEERESPGVYDALAEGYSSRPTGLLVLPHFAGAATPYMDLGSRGAILGLDLSSKREDMYLALLEGVAYEMRLNIERLQQHGVAIRDLFASGGGSKNAVWNQIKADVTGLPIHLLEGEEAGSRGAAMLIATAAGKFDSLAECAQRFVRERDVVEPNPLSRREYDRVYHRYQKMYGAIRPLMEEEE